MKNFNGRMTGNINKKKVDKNIMKHPGHFIRNLEGEELNQLRKQFFAKIPTKVEKNNQYIVSQSVEHLRNIDTEICTDFSKIKRSLRTTSNYRKHTFIQSDEYANIDIKTTIESPISIQNKGDVAAFFQLFKKLTILQMSVSKELTNQIFENFSAIKLIKEPVARHALYTLKKTGRFRSATLHNYQAEEGEPKTIKLNHERGLSFNFKFNNPRNLKSIRYFDAEVGYITQEELKFILEKEGKNIFLQKFNQKPIYISDGNNIKGLKTLLSYCRENTGKNQTGVLKYSDPAYKYAVLYRFALQCGILKMASDLGHMFEEQYKPIVNQMKAHLRILESKKKQNQQDLKNIKRQRLFLTRIEALSLKFSELDSLTRTYWSDRKTSMMIKNSFGKSHLKHSQEEIELETHFKENFIEIDSKEGFIDQYNAITAAIEEIMSQTRKLEKKLVEKKSILINGEPKSISQILKEKEIAKGRKPKIIPSYDGIMLEFLNGFQMIDLLFYYLIEPQAVNPAQKFVLEQRIVEKFSSIFKHYQTRETTRNFDLTELKFHKTSQHPGSEYLNRIKTGDNDYVWRVDAQTKGNYFEMAGGKSTSSLYFHDLKKFPLGSLKEPIFARITGSAIGYKHLIYIDRKIALDKLNNITLDPKNGFYHRFEFLTNSFYETIHMDNNIFGSSNWNGVIDITTEEDLRHLVDFDNPFIGTGMDHVFLKDTQGKPRFTCSIFAACVIDPSFLEPPVRKCIINGLEVSNNDRTIRKFFKTDNDKDKGAKKRVHGAHYCDGTLRFPHHTTAKEFRDISFTDEIMGSKLRKYSDLKIGLFQQSILSATTLLPAVPMWELDQYSGDAGFIHNGTTYKVNPFLKHFIDLMNKMPGEKLPILVEIDKPRLAYIIHNCLPQQFVDQVKIKVFGSVKAYRKNFVSTLFIECLATLYTNWKKFVWILPFEESKYGKHDYKNMLKRLGYVFDGMVLIEYNKNEYRWYIDALMHSKVPNEAFWKLNLRTNWWETIYGTPASQFLNEQLNSIEVWVGGNPMLDGPGYLRVLRQKLQLLYRQKNYEHIAKLLGFRREDKIQRLILCMNQSDKDLDKWLKKSASQLPEINIQHEYGKYGYLRLLSSIRKKRSNSELNKAQVIHRCF